MSKKKITRVQLAELWELTELLWGWDLCSESHDSIIKRRIALCKQIDNDLWMCIFDLAPAVYRMKDKATAEDLEAVLEVLGWQVTDDGEET